MRLEKTSVGLTNLVGIIVAVMAGTLWLGAIAKDVESNSKMVKPMAAQIQKIDKNQAVIEQRLKSLERSMAEVKRDQKEGFEKVLEELQKK